MEPLDLPIAPQALPEPIVNAPGALGLYRIVVLGLVGIALLVVAGTLILAALGKVAPESAVVLGSVAVGALASMLNSERPQ
jgi:hypothetical protein